MANIEIRQNRQWRVYIKVHETDNVAILLMTTVLKVEHGFPDGLELTEHIPQRP